MRKNDIIESLTKYTKDYPNRTFYQKCIRDINSLPDNDIIKSIVGDKYILESIRVTVLYNINKYKIYLSNVRIDNCTNYLLDIDLETKQKLVYQLACITKYNSILALENDQFVPEIDFSDNMFVVISIDKPNIVEGLYELKNLYEISGYIFGIEIFKIVKYQKLDRIIEFIKKFDKGDMNGYNVMENYVGHMRKYDWTYREQFIVMNNMIFNTIGLTCKNKVELFGLLDWNSKDAMSLASEFEDNVDAIITTNNESVYDKNGKCGKYSYRWLMHVLPAYVGVESMYDVLYDPTHTFSFMGIKFVSLDFAINKLVFGINSTNYLDLMMLENINGYTGIGDKLCIPNMIVYHGKITIFDDDLIKKMFEEIKKGSKEIYGVELTPDAINNKLQKCNVNAFDIYQGKHLYDPDTALIKKFHLDVKAKIFFEYCKNKNYLLDIGSGQLTDAMFWNKVGIKNVIGIEPSATSIKNGYERLKKFGSKAKINIVNGIGNEDWTKDKKYSIVLANSYDVVTFQFTIHYMIYDIDVVINNFSKLCRSGAIVIVTCMDGNKIHNEIHKNGFIEVRNDVEPLFAIYPKYDYRRDDLPVQSDVMVYFKGAFGLGGDGSIEKLVDIAKLVGSFKKFGFGLLKHKDFLDYQSRIKDEMSNIQKKVSYYYTSLVFKKY